MKEGKKGRPCPFCRHHAGEKELFNADHMVPPATYKALSSQMSCPSAPFNRQKAGTCTLVDGKLTNVHWEFIWGLSFCASDQTRQCLDLLPTLNAAGSFSPRSLLPPATRGQSTVS